MALTAEEQAELAELEKEFGTTGGLTPAEAAELAELEKEFGPATTSRLTPEEQAELAELEKEFAPMETIKSMTPKPGIIGNRGAAAQAQRAQALEAEAIMLGLSPEQYQTAMDVGGIDDSLLDPSQRATRYREYAKPNQAEDILLSAGSGIMNTLGTIGAVVQGAPGSAYNAVMGPDLDDFTRQYAPGSFKDWSQDEIIALYNQEQARKGLPMYQDQVSSMPTISENMAAWETGKQGTLASYEPQTRLGKVAEFTGALAGGGGVGSIPRTAVVGAIGSTADQLTEGTELNMPVTLGTTIFAGGLTGLRTATTDDVARATANAEQYVAARAARAAIDEQTRKMSLFATVAGIAKANEGKLAQIMSAVRVQAGAGLDQSLFGGGNLLRSGLMGASEMVAGGIPTAIRTGLAVANTASRVAANPSARILGSQSIRTAPKALIVEGGQISELPDDVAPLEPLR